MREINKRNSSLLAVLLALLLAHASSAQDMPLSQVLIDDQPWQLVGEGYQFTEGPTVTPDGTLFFADVPASVIYRVSKDGKPEIFVEESDRTSGLMFGPRGLYGCSSATKCILLFDPFGKRSLIAQDVTSNDLVVTGLRRAAHDGTGFYAADLVISRIESRIVVGVLNVQRPTGGGNMAGNAIAHRQADLLEVVAFEQYFGP